MSVNNQESRENKITKQILNFRTKDTDENCKLVLIPKVRVASRGSFRSNVEKCSDRRLYF